MKYIGFFYDTNKVRYQVMIDNKDEKTIDGYSELLFAPNPFVVEYETDDLYKPYKCSRATINLLDYHNLLFDLEGKKNIPVTLHRINTKTDENDLVWCGVLSNDVLTQDFNEEVTNLSLTAVDYISLLKYKPYKRLSYFKGIVTFRDLIVKAFESIDELTTLFVHNTLEYIHIQSEDFNKNRPLVQNLSFFEDNFFNEDGEPVTILEALESVLKALNFTLIAQGDKMYILDYKALGNGFTEFLEYYKGDGGIELYSLDLSNTINLNPSLFAGTDTTITKEQGYNKFSVSCATNPFEYSFNDDLYNKAYYEGTKEYFDVGLPRYYETTPLGSSHRLFITENGKGDRYTDDNRYTKDGNKEDILVFDNYRYVEDKVYQNRVFLRLFHPNQELFKANTIFDEIKTYCYSKEKGKNINNTPLINKAYSHKTLKENITCLACQYDIRDYKVGDNYNINFNESPYFIFSKNFGYLVGDNDWWEMPVLKIKTKPLKLKKSSYLILSGALEAFRARNEYFPNKYYIDEETDNEDYGTYFEVIRKHSLVSRIVIKFGKKYLNNNNELTSEPTFYNIPLDLKDIEPNKKFRAFNTPIRYKNNLSYRDKLTEYKEGHGIKLDFLGDEVTQNTIEIIFYNEPFLEGLRSKHQVTEVPHTVVLKDFNIDIVDTMNTYLFEKENKDNSSTNSNYYETITDENRVEADRKIDLKFSIDNTNTYNKGTLLCYDDVTSKHIKLKHLYNKGTGEILPPQLAILNELQIQKGQPYYIINTTLFNDKTNIKPYSVFNYHYIKNPMIPNKWSVDYKSNSVNIELIQKRGNEYKQS